MSDVVIHAEKLGKLYHIGPRERYKTLRDVLANPFRRKRSGNHDTIWALKDVSFEVKQGEVIGIIGRNGAGKSTLLKILSRITEPTEGYADITGRVGSLLEVGTGFHPELTGRENIYLNGAILGMKQGEIGAKFDEIVAFAEVEKFIDTPVKHYSSGMHVRLAFAVAAHLEPEILLVDEVLAVGDASFQKKCLGKMGDVAKAGRTVFFVSHNMAAIGLLCTVGFHLQNGKLVEIGEVAPLVARYLKGFEVESDQGEISDTKRTDRSNLIRITHATLQNSKSEKTNVLYYKEPFELRLIFEVLNPVDQVRLGLGIDRMDGSRIATSHHTDGGLSTLTLGKGRYAITVRLENRLTPGEYKICVGAHELKTRLGLDFVPNAVRFTVMELSADQREIHDPFNIGPAILPATWTDLQPCEPNSDK